ncbi:hypothetical protein BH10PAT1_BH10PAT1_7310 [soil metagenome]
MLEKGRFVQSLQEIKDFLNQKHEPPYFPGVLLRVNTKDCIHSSGIN